MGLKHDARAAVELPKQGAFPLVFPLIDDDDDDDPDESVTLPQPPVPSPWEEEQQG